MPDAIESDLPTSQRDYEPGALVEETVVFSLQVQDEDGRWMHFLTPRSNRDELTMIQADRLRRFPEERRRVIRRVSQDFVDEVEGDGDGEVSAKELLARNDAIVKRLMEKDQQPAS